MDADYFRTLFDHLYWGRDKVLSAADGMSEEEYARPNGFTYKSIRGILTHCLAGEANWMARARGQAPVPTREDDLPTVAALKARWSEDGCWAASSSRLEIVKPTPRPSTLLRHLCRCRNQKNWLYHDSCNRRLNGDLWRRLVALYERPQKSKSARHNDADKAKYHKLLPSPVLIVFPLV